MLSFTYRYSGIILILDIFPLQGKLLNSRYIFDYSAMESTITLDFDRNLIKYIYFLILLLIGFFMTNAKTLRKFVRKKNVVPCPKTYIPITVIYKKKQY